MNQTTKIDPVLRKQTRAGLFQRTEKSEAHVVDGKLILALPGAISPIVWQMDLAQAKASALEILTDTESGEASYKLTLKTPRGEKMDIAAFASQKQALTALKTAARALSQAQGKIASGENNSQIHAHIRKRGGWIKPVLLTLLAVFLLLAALMILVPPATNTGGPANITRAPTPNNTIGVPMSADDFLQRRP